MYDTCGCISSTIFAGSAIKFNNTRIKWHKVDIDLYVYMYMYIFTYIHTYIHTYIDTYIQTYIHISIYCIHVYRYICRTSNFGIWD